MENRKVLTWIHKHDIVFLGEIKSGKPPCVPGFRCEIARNIKSTRGGVAVLLKNHIAPELCELDKSTNEQVWFSLKSLPNIRFCGAYISPSNSLYSSVESIANLQAQTMNKEKHYIIAGDLNARFGSKIHELISDNGMSYSPVDLGENDNGKAVLQVCKDQNLYVVNNIHTRNKHLKGDLTYRKRRKWISEVDICLVSKSLIDNIISLSVDKDMNLPSDHADKRIDTDKLHDQLSVYVPVIDNSMSIDQVAEQFSDKLYECILDSEQQPTDTRVFDNELLPRWQRILEWKDDATLWKAIDWKGECSTTKENSSCPTESEFQIHLERLLNPPDLSEEVNISDASPTIPILDDEINVREIVAVKTGQT